MAARHRERFGRRDERLERFLSRSSPAPSLATSVGETEPRTPPVPATLEPELIEGQPPPQQLEPLARQNSAATASACSDGDGSSDVGPEQLFREEAGSDVQGRRTPPVPTALDPEPLMDQSSPGSTCSDVVGSPDHTPLFHGETGHDVQGRRTPLGPATLTAEQLGEFPPSPVTPEPELPGKLEEPALEEPALEGHCEGLAEPASSEDGKEDFLEEERLQELLLGEIGPDLRGRQPPEPQPLPSQEER